MSEFEQALDSGDFSKINKEDFRKWATAQAEAHSRTLNPQGSMSTKQDALNQRDLKAQADSQSQAPPRPPRRRGPLPSTQIKPYQFNDKTAANTLRLAVGPNLLSRIVHTGNNFVIADAEHYALTLDALDQLMIGTKKFTDAALGWHPLFSRYYCSLIFYLSQLRSMQLMNVVPPMLSMLIDQLFERYPLECWPVPGPLVPFLQQLSISSPDFEELGDVCPILPFAPLLTANQGHSSINLNGRSPNVYVLIDQIVRYLSYVQGGTDNSNRVERASQWPLFLRTVLGNDQLSNDPGDPYEQTTFADATPASRVRDFNGPMLNTGFHLTASAGQMVVDNRARLRRAFGTTNLTTRNVDRLTWFQFFGISNDYAKLDVVLPMMAIYCSHVSASCSLADIQPIGHMGLQITCEIETPLPVPEVNDAATNVASSTRFMVHDLKFRVYNQNRQMVPADAADAAICALNFSKLEDGDGINRPQGTADEYDLDTREERIGGPFFSKFPRLDHSTVVDPRRAYLTLIASNYHSQTPLRSNVPTA